MSVSAAPLPVRRRPFPYILLAMLGALALIAALVALAVSNSSSSSIGATAKSAGVRPQPVLTPVDPTSLRSTPGPGHK
jgi:hypothetical protein